MSETISEMFSALIDVWKEMFSIVIAFLPKMIHFVLWILTAVIILPCVFVAGNLYPKWVEWGEDF